METPSDTKDEPKDRFKLVTLIFLMQGITMLMGYKMFINAQSYFVDYKLGYNYTQQDVSYNKYFVQYLTFATQTPNVIFTYVNCFVRIAGNVTLRIVGSLAIIMLVFHFQVALGLVDTSQIPVFFFWGTMVSVVVMMTFNAIYNNSILGIAAILPSRYVKIALIGNTSSGIFTSVTAIITVMSSGELKTAGIYYFITAIIVLYTALDTYFALPLIKYYRYYKEKNDDKVAQRPKVNYGHVIKKTIVQLYNLTFNFIVTYACFPAITANIQPSSEDFFIPKQYYGLFMAFLTFNVTIWLGTIVAAFIQFPKPKWIWIIITLRVLFIPFFLLSNYRPVGKRELDVVFNNDYVFFVMHALLGFTSGYYYSIGMTYVPKMVEPEYARNAGMLSGVAYVTGTFLGIMITFIWPSLIM